MEGLGGIWQEARNFKIYQAIQYIYIYNYYYINGIISNLNIYVICAPMYIN